MKRVTPPWIQDDSNVGHGSDRNSLTVCMKPVPNSAVCNMQRDVEIITFSNKDSDG
jgi:hypothetical protein